MKKVNAIFTYAILGLAAIISIFPFLWMLSTALKPNKQTFKYPPEWIPRPFTLDNFARVWNDIPLDTFIKNTVFVTVVILVGQLIFTSMAAYSFSRLRYRGRELIFIVLLGSLMIPEIVTMIPQYVMMKHIGWLDSFKAIIVPQLFGNAFGVFLLRQYFQDIPKELDEAARIDGLGIVGTYYKIILPLSKPILSTLAVFMLVKSWNNFLWPLIVINSTDKYMLSVGLAQLQGQYTADWSGTMAFAFVALVPILIVFAFAQRFFIQSIQMSGLK